MRAFWRWTGPVCFGQFSRVFSPLHTSNRFGSAHLAYRKHGYQYLHFIAMASLKQVWFCSSVLSPTFVVALFWCVTETGWLWRTHQAGDSLRIKQLARYLKNAKFSEKKILSGLPRENLEKMIENGVVDVRKTAIFSISMLLHPHHHLEIFQFGLTFHHFRSQFSNFQSQSRPQTGFQKGSEWSLLRVRVTTFEGQNDHFRDGNSPERSRNSDFSPRRHGFWLSKTGILGGVR